MTCQQEARSATVRNALKGLLPDHDVDSMLGAGRSLGKFDRTQFPTVVSRSTVESKGVATTGLDCLYATPHRQSHRLDDLVGRIAHLRVDPAPQGTPRIGR